jgi:hypothetical protein
MLNFRKGEDKPKRKGLIVYVVKIVHFSLDLTSCFACFENVVAKEKQMFHLSNHFTTFPLYTSE